MNDDGTPGERNDLRCVSIEHKMGIHASPTCVMSYGDEGGAIGYLVGEEHRGMRAMFTMMNSARIAVGVQGVAIGDAAYQKALTYSTERIQGSEIGGDTPGAVPIITPPRRASDAAVHEEPRRGDAGAAGLQRRGTRSEPCTRR